MINKNIINKNYKHFQDQLPKLMQKHLNKVALIKDQEIVKIFNTIDEADQFVIEKKYKSGTFLIQEINNTIHHISRLA